MEFFSELRSAVRRIERGVKEVQQDAGRHRPPDDTDRHKAFLLLRHKADQLKEMEAESSRVSKDLRQNKFLETVEAIKLLVAKNQEMLEETEEHLKQYGYQPLPLPSPADSKSTKHNQVNGDQINGDPDKPALIQTDPEEMSEAASSPDRSSNSHDLESDQPTTPDQNGDPPPITAVGRTPKLADFGISESTMRLFSSSYKGQGHSHRDRNQSGDSNQSGNRDRNQSGESKCDVEFKLPGEPPSSLRPPRTQKAAWAPDMDRAMPAEFDHDGLFVTPSMMPGIMSHKTPMTDGDRRKFAYCQSPVGSAVGDYSPGRAQDIVTSLRLHSDGSDDSNHGNSPQRPGDLPRSPTPPILMTPGLKQMRKPVLDILQVVPPPPDNTTPELPEFVTPGLKKSLQVRPKLVKEEEELPVMADDDSVSPIPPVLQTPGLKQFHKSSLNTTIENTRTDLGTSPDFRTTHSNVFDTPEMPELTTDIGRLLMKQMPCKPEIVVPQELSTACEYIPEMTEQEYMCQQKYIRNILALDKVNLAINKLNQLVASRFKDDGEVLVSEADLRDDLTVNQVKLVYLCMMRLGRIRIRHESDGNKYYALCV